MATVDSVRALIGERSPVVGRSVKPLRPAFLP